MRRGAQILGALVAVLLPVAAARAAPKVHLLAKAVPIAGFTHTGNIFRAGESLEVELQVEGVEYGGFAAPLTHVGLYLPSGTKLHPTAFPVCAPTELEPSGTGRQGCPKGSAAGPVGAAEAFVAFGTEVVPETATIEPFYAPGGGLTLFMFGHAPVLLEALYRTQFLPPAGVDGPKLEMEVPLLETIPGAQDTTLRLLKFKIGSALRKAGVTTYYFTAPASCPDRYEPFRVELTFAGIGGLRETTVPAEYKAPCPRPVEASEKPGQEAPPEALPGTGGVVTAPPAKVCTSRRDFRIHVVHIPHLEYRLVTVELNGKPVKVLRGRRTSAQINLRGLPKGRYVARIGVVTTSGRLITGTRTYHTCAAHAVHPKRPPRL